MEEILSAGQILSDDEILRELSKVARSKVDLKGSDKMKGLELLAKHRGLIKERVETTDTTDRDATVEALTQHIAAAALREGVSDDAAALGLFSRMADHPTLSSPAAWGKWRGVIEADIAARAKTSAVSDVEGNM